MIHPNLPERALSIRQPWAWAIVNAGKRIENRPRRTHYRGPICIHASLYDKEEGHGNAMQAIWDASQIDPPLSNRCQRGGIIATAEIVKCVETSDSPWFSGPYGWVLENVQPVPFIPIKGALGLFRWRANLTTTKEEQDAIR